MATARKYTNATKAIIRGLASPIVTRLRRGLMQRPIEEVSKDRLSKP